MSSVVEELKSLFEPLRCCFHPVPAFQRDIAGDPDFDVARNQSVCRATIARAYGEPEDPALIFEDLAASEFAELPAVAAEGGVRFYAGFPLYGPGGHPVGTFCVYDTEPM